MQALKTEKVSVQASANSFSGLVSFCKMSVIHAALFYLGRIESLRPDSPLSTFRTRFCCRSYRSLVIRFIHSSCVVTTSPAPHSRRFQSFTKSMAPFARNEQLVPQHLYDLASFSASSFNNDQQLGYGTTMLAPPQILSPPLSQLLCLLRCLWPPSPFVKDTSFCHQKENGSAKQNTWPSPPGFINVLACSQKPSMSFGSNELWHVFSISF